MDFLMSVSSFEMVLTEMSIKKYLGIMLYLARKLSFRETIWSLSSVSQVEVGMLKDPRV